MKIVLKIEGMHCEGCKKRVENVLSNNKDLKNINVSLENKQVEYESKNENIEDVKKSIENLGFKVIGE